MSALALPLLPVATALALLVVSRGARVQGAVAAGGIAATLALGVWAASAQLSATWQWSPAITLGVAVQGYGRVMVVLVPLVAAPILAYAAATEEDGRARLLALMTAFVGTMLLLVMASDFLTLLVAWELVGATSWALIGHNWRDAEHPRAAAQAFVTTRLGDVGLYLAAGAVFAAAGSFAYADLGGVGRPALDVIAAGVLLAAAAKSAQLPFAPWLFAAMAGPTPVSALLHSATMVAAGAYLLIRVAPALEPVGWFLPAAAGIGVATAIAGGVVAVLQRHAKRVLAASTSAQYGLMFLAVGAGSVAASGAHLVAHAAFKSLLFLSAGVAIHAAGTSELGGMRLGRALPLVAALSLAGVLALAAVPPLGAAWTKEQVAAAAVHTSGWLGVGAFAAGALSALYAARYHLLALGRAGTDGRPGRVVAPGMVEVAAMAVLAAATLGLSALWLPAARGPVETLTQGALVEGAPWEFAVSLAAVTGGAGVAWWLARRGGLVSLGLGEGVQARAEDWLGLARATQVLVVSPVVALSSALASADERVVDAGVLTVAGMLAAISRRLGRFDDRVVDAGVRGVAAAAGLVSRLFSRRGEWTFDGAVHATAEATMRLAGGSRVADDGGIDAAVEDTARRVGVAAQLSRRLQTGLAHHYYVILAGGMAAVALLLALA